MQQPVILADKYDIVFDAVLQTIPQVNNESLHKFCHERFTTTGTRGCLYVSYNNMHEMLHTDQHKIGWKPLSFIEQICATSYQPVIEDILKYDPETSYVLLVSCETGKEVLFKHKVIDGTQNLAESIPQPQFRQQVVHIPVCHNCSKTSKNLQRCAACSSVLYCSKECQKAHWPEHRSLCVELRKAKQKGNNTTETA